MPLSTPSTREERRAEVGEVRRSAQYDVNRPLPPLPLQGDVSRRPSRTGAPISIPSTPRRPRMKSRPSTADSTKTTSSTSSTSSRLGFLDLAPLSPSSSFAGPSSPPTVSPSSPKPRRPRLSSLFPLSSPSLSPPSSPATGAARPRPQISQPLAPPTLSAELEERYGPMPFCALAQVLRSPGFGQDRQRESWDLLPKDRDQRD